MVTSNKLEYYIDRIPPFIMRFISTIAIFWVILQPDHVEGLGVGFCQLPSVARGPVWLLLEKGRSMPSLAATS